VKRLTSNELKEIAEEVSRAIVAGRPDDLAIAADEVQRLLAEHAHMKRSLEAADKLFQRATARGMTFCRGRLSDAAFEYLVVKRKRLVKVV